MTTDSTRNQHRRRAIVFVGVATLAGSASMLGVHHLIGGYQAAIDAQRQPEDTVMVMVAARDLYQGIAITDQDLYAVEIPPRHLTEGVFLTPDHLVGRIPRERVLANEFVRSDRLANPESGTGMNAVIPRGMRALSVNIRDARALSGFLNPGNYVDLLVTLDPKGDGELQTKTLMQAMFVLGVNSRMEHEGPDEARKRRGRNGQTVTLLVSAAEAEELAFAENQGELRLLLRKDDELDEILTPGVDIDALRGQLRPLQVTRTSARVEDDNTIKVYVIRGDRVEIEAFDEDGVRR